MITTKSPVEKSPLMIGMILCLWVALSVFYLPRFWPLLGLAESIWEKLIYSYCVVWIALTWLYGAFHIIGVCFALFSKKIVAPGPDHRMENAPVAVLYTTKNDFNAEAAESCVNQDYPNMRVYLLDDSTETEEKELVNRFHRLHPTRTTLVRRRHKNGFKAGNLNHALRTAARDCRYFAVVDSDEIVPPNFVSRAVRHFSLDPRIGFVQANHRYSTDSTSRFARDMSQSVDLHWERFLSPRNRFGFVMFYGHGAVIRRDVWEAVGGFPEVVSEDIAFSVMVRMKGSGGVFLKDLVAYEEFPNSFVRFVTRELKVVRGTLEFLAKYSRSLVFSSSVSLTEKVDLLLSLSVLYLAAPFLLFVILANVAVPVCVVLKTYPFWLLKSVGIGSFAKLLEPLGANIRHLWTWDFYLLIVGSILSPLVYQLPRFFRHPIRTLKYLFQSTAVYLSVVPSMVAGILSYPVKRRVSFNATGDRREKSGKLLPGMLFGGITGACLTAAGLITNNLSLLTVSLSFILFPVFMRCRWDNRLVRAISFVPFVFFAVVFGSIPFLMVGIVGIFASVVPSHH